MNMKSIFLTALCALSLATPFAQAQSETEKTESQSPFDKKVLVQLGLSVGTLACFGALLHYGYFSSYHKKLSNQKAALIQANNELRASFLKEAVAGANSSKNLLDVKLAASQILHEMDLDILSNAELFGSIYQSLLTVIPSALVSTWIYEKLYPTDESTTNEQ